MSEAALRLAGAVRAELLEVMQRIELPVSPPAFGTDSNVLHLKQALLSGFFLKVRLPPGAALPGWGGREEAVQPFLPGRLAGGSGK